MATLHKTSLTFVETHMNGTKLLLCVDGKSIGYVHRLELDDLLHVYEIEVDPIERMPGVPPVEEDVPDLMKPAIKLRPRSEFGIIATKKKEEKER
jgi:hypothetical protein